jgi:D-threo-aldose 1-dehydrogenase
VTLPEAAMAFPLRHPAVAGIVVGMRSADDVRRNLTAFAKPVPDSLWTDLAATGLVDERVPQEARRPTPLGSSGTGVRTPPR